jgi:hypothetical protein
LPRVTRRKSGVTQARLLTARSTHITAPMTSRIMPIHSRNDATFTAIPRIRRTIPTMISVITIPINVILAASRSCG